MTPKHKTSRSDGKNVLPPVKAPLMHGLPPVKAPPILQRKSSSASILDISGGASVKGADQKEDSGFPKLERKTSSLQDFRQKDEDNKANGNKIKSKHGDKNKKSPTNGWSNAESGDSLPKVGTQGGNKPSTANYQRTNTRRRRANDIMLTRPATIAVVVKYQLGQHELKKFKACFRQIDMDASGVIDYDEFFEFIDETKTPFSEGLFRMIDSDSNGSIDFEEFVHATVLYCMYTRDEILHYPAATGSIGDKELRRLIGMVNDGQAKFSGNINNGLAEFDRNKDGVIDFPEFKNLNKRFPMLLFPCFRLQDRMQKATLGHSHWLQLHKRLYERLKAENYQRKHNGALPSLTIVGAIVKFLRLDSRDVYQP